MVSKSFRPKIVRNDEGVPFSSVFKDIYASRDDAYDQADYVFLRGNDLPARWQGQPQFVILENGFGLGTNFLACLKQWRENKKSGQVLHYVAIEAFPPSAEQIMEFADPKIKSLAEELASKWSLTVPGLWQTEFKRDSVFLTIYFMDTKRASKVLSLGFDALFLDGFSPSKNPAMWEPKVLKDLAKHARKNATLATWCVAGKVKKALEESGFVTQKVTGFGHKKQMLKGKFEPKFAHRRQNLAIEKRHNLPQRVLVIGAGLAGAAVAKIFSTRGLEVEVIDAGRVVGSGASAIRWGIAHTQYATDDNFLFRLTRVGFRLLKESLKDEGYILESSGLFQVAKDDIEYKKWSLNFQHSLPFEMADEGFIQLLDKEKAAKKIGLLPARGGLWHSEAAVVAISQWVRNRINKYATKLRLNVQVASLKKEGEKWVAFDFNNQLLSSADMVVLCSAHGTQQLCPIPLNLTRCFGRLSLVYDDSLNNLKQAVFGPGYAIHSVDGWSAIGATYEMPGSQLSAEQAHESNLSHLRSMFPQCAEVGVKGFYEGYRVISSDRLPIVGAAESPDKDESLEGLYVSCAMGSRGLLFSEVAARIICAQCYGEPMCLESDLVAAISPSRFKDKGK